MKFSIVIAAFNAEKEIARTLESTLDQTYSDYEVIVVNDASTDKTPEIVAEFDRVRLINNEINMKAGGSRNRGIEAANGEYIIFLDSDDILASNDVLEKLAKAIEENGDTDLVYIGMNSSDNERNLIPNAHNSVKETRLVEWTYANVCDVCWNKEFLNKNDIRFVEHRFFEDFPFYYEGLLKSESYNFVEFPVITYTRNRAESMTTKFNMQKIIDYYSNMMLLSELYMKTEDRYKEGLWQAIIRQHKNIEFYMLNMRRDDE